MPQQKSNIPLRKTNKKFYRHLASLSEKERQIMEFRFGITNGEEQTIKETSEQLKIPTNHIRRIEKRVLQQLRSILNS